jgi:hypothetical protein
MGEKSPIHVACKFGIVKQLEWEDTCQHQTPICKQIGIVKQLE